MELRRAILDQLADGAFHSGATLARQLQRSRTAVWKGVRGLSRAGMDIFAVRGKGYRLADRVELLDEVRIRQDIAPAMAGEVRGLEVFFNLESTNDFLFAAKQLHGCAVLAEYQSAGRGRRGNRWWSPPASGLCLSLGWRFESAPDALMMLSLFTAAAVLRALHQCGIAGVGLKWPNDIVHERRKLGGILIESRGQIAGALDVVIGLGLNVRLPPRGRPELDQPVTDLATIAGALPSRNHLAALLITRLLQLCRDCEAGETQAYLHEWRRHDACKGLPARLKLPDRELHGTIIDVDERGHLVMRIGAQEQRFSSGELSLRVDP